MFSSVVYLNLATLQNLTLEYLGALYPFVLILFSYFIIKLHDRSTTFRVTVWKPFHKVLTIFQRSLDFRTPIRVLSVIYLMLASLLGYFSYITIL